MKPAAFLDRDGVINVDRAYVHRKEDFTFVPGIIDAMARLQRAGYLLIVVTNQSGLARGYFTEEDYFELTHWMLQELEVAGVHVSGVYHCPHHPSGRVPKWSVACDCRKPKPGLILQAQREHGLDLSESILIGDKESDIEAALAAGVGRAFLVQPGSDVSASSRSKASDVCSTAWACVDKIL